MVIKKRKSKKKEEKVKCDACDSDQVVTRIVDTLSVDARPIQEMEIRCLACSYRKTRPYG